jgi:DNA-binding GntR family transcriptional regulator
MSFSLKDVNEILQVREVLEGMACALAAKNMTDDEIAALKQLIEQHEQQKTLQEGKGYYQEANDFDFHYRIVTGSRNERVCQMLLGDLYYLLRVYRYKSSTRPACAVSGLQEHKDIVEAIARRDPVMAEQKMRLHIQKARKWVEGQIELSEPGLGKHAQKAQGGP